MPCMCGDVYCPSCGPGQGNSRCPACGRWTADGGCENPEVCGLLNAASDAALYQSQDDEHRAAEAYFDAQHPTADDLNAPEGFTDQF